MQKDSPGAKLLTFYKHAMEQILMTVASNIKKAVGQGLSP